MQRLKSRSAEAGHGIINYADLQMDGILISSRHQLFLSTLAGFGFLGSSYGVVWQLCTAPPQ